VATACSGTDLAIPVLRMAASVAGCNVRFQHIYSCEVDKIAQRWIMNYVRPAPLVLFRDLSDIAADCESLDVISGGPVGSLVDVPMDIFIAGFECKNISGLNAQRSKQCLAKQDHPPPQPAKSATAPQPSVAL
jgi:hypothetical protein